MNLGRGSHVVHSLSSQSQPNVNDQEYKESLIVSLRCPKSHIIILNMHYFECKECAFIEVSVKQCGRTEERYIQTFGAVAEVAHRGICLLAS